MADQSQVLGSLRSVDGHGVVRMELRLDVGIEEVWRALTDPSALIHWFGELQGEPSAGGEFRVRVILSGERTGTVEACSPPQHLLLSMRDPDPQPGQPAQTTIEVQLTAESSQTKLVWEQRGLPEHLLAAYGTGIQIHVEHLEDHLHGRELRDIDARWDELLPAYEGLRAGR